MMLNLPLHSAESHNASSDIFFQHLSNESGGLSNNGVRALLQDSRGYVWIGTQMGLNRYDGSRLEVFPVNALPSSYIFSMGEDKKGNVWIGTGNGIAFYDYRKDCLVEPTFEDGSKLKLAIYSIGCNSKEEVWFDARENELYSYDYKTGFIRKRDIRLGHKTIKRIAFNADDDLVICSHLDNIYIYSETSGITKVIQLEKGADLLRDDEILGPVFDRHSNFIFYVATKKSGILKINLKEKSARVLYGLSVLQKPNGLTMQNDRFLLCSTTFGLVRYDLQTSSVTTYYNDPDNPHSLADNYVLSAIADANGCIWAGTAQYGVCYTSPATEFFQRLEVTSDGMSLKGSKVRAICESRDGSVWIGTERLGLLRYDPLQGKLNTVSLKGVPKFITSLMSNEDDLWIGTQSGLFRYDSRLGRVRKYEYFGDSEFSGDSRVITIFKSSDGKIYVAASSSTLVYDSKSDSFEMVRNAGIRAYVSMTEDAQGKIWLASYSQGLYSIDPNDAYLVRAYPECPIVMISSVLTDKEGNIIVVGYNATISKYDIHTGRFSTFPADSLGQMYQHSNTSALVDRSNHIWLGSDRGLIDTDILTGSSVTYNVRHGIVDNAISAAMESSSDVMYFGSLDGVVKFNPEKVRNNAESGRIDVVSLRVGGRKITPAETDAVIDRNINLIQDISLPYNENSIAFEFAAPTSYMPVVINCFLEGYDESPKNVSDSREVAYYGLLPGQYLFHLTSHNDIKITIRPPFLQSTTGIILLVLVFVFVMGVFVCLLYRSQRRRQERKLIEYRRTAEAEMVKDKMSFLSNVVHEIKTPLTLMKTPLKNLSSEQDLPESVRNDIKRVTGSADYLDKLSRELLTFITAAESNYVIERKKLNLTEIVSGIVCDFSESARARGIEIDLILPDEPVFIMGDQGAVSKIVNNLLGNALKYSDAFIQVEIKLNDDGSSVLLFIRNDGKPIPETKRNDIFKPFVTLNKERGNLQQTSFGIGLPLALSLARLHSGTLVLTPSELTEFLLTIPCLPEEDFAPVENGMTAEDKPSILILEDNGDLLRFLKDELSGDYSVYTSENAKAAMAELSKSHIDCILADLNIPGMNGIDFCRNVNLNFASSHIPVIIISANASEAAKIKCMEFGASLYIEKPFTIEYLKASITSVLNKRTVLMNLAKDSISEFNFTQFGLEERDSVFLKKLDEIVSGNLANEKFSVSNLEEALALSHSTLNRRMKELLQMSSVDYIKTKRMNAAMLMLKEGKYTIQEIAFAVGFSSLSWFSRCFKDYYGKSPANYLKQK